MPAWPPRRLKRWMRWWPPYLGAGVRIVEAADDGTRLVVEHRFRFWNQNGVGVVFGGTMQAMTDPFFMLLAMHQLGPGYVVWDVEGAIEYLRPGTGDVRAVIEMPPEAIEEVRAACADGRGHRRWFSCDVVDDDGQVIAHVRRRVYFRRKPPKDGSPARPGAAEPLPERERRLGEAASGEHAFGLAGEPEPGHRVQHHGDRGD